MIRIKTVKSAIVIFFLSAGVCVATYGCGGRQSNSLGSPILPMPPGSNLTNAPANADSTAALASLTTSSGPYHIATAAYDDKGGEGQSASAAQVNLLVSYALNQGSDKPLEDCHSGSRQCKAVYYIRPFAIIKPTSGCSQRTDAAVINAASESWFVHDKGYTGSSHSVYGKN